MLYLRFQTKLNLTDDTRSGEVDMNSVLRVMKTMTVDNLEDGMSIFFQFRGEVCGEAIRKESNCSMGEEE